MDEQQEYREEDSPQGDEITLREVSAQLGIPFQETLKPDGVEPSLVATIPIGVAKKYTFVPIQMKGDTIVVATAHPLDLQTFDELQFLLQKKVRLIAAPEHEVLRIINLLYDLETDNPEQVVQGLAEDDEEDKLLHELEEVEDLLDDASEAPVIKLVNLFLSQAIRARASDIHIEPYQKEVNIRYRIDGVLYNMHTLPRRFQSAITSRVKIMSKLDIAEKRLPQDGRIMIKIADKDVDIRVSVIPTTFGERIVLRLLDKRSIFYSLEEIGLSQEKLKVMNRLIRGANGIILVTGPTGGGKTTTLYAALDKINSPDKNIITIEDPVEYQLPGIGQIHVNPKIGLTFANGLRSIVRQDPDVILVGEVRDLETVLGGDIPQLGKEIEKEPFEFKSKSQLIEFLRQRGYEVVENAIVKGGSGAEHSLDILAIRDDGIITHHIAIGTEVADKPVGLDDVFDFDDKAYDIGIQDKVFITVPGFTEEARQFAQRQRIKVFEVKQLEPSG